MKDLKEAYEFFEEILHKAKHIDFKQEWFDNGGFYSGIRYLELNEVCCFEDSLERLGIVIPTPFGNVLVYERYKEDRKILMSDMPPIFKVVGRMDIASMTLIRKLSESVKLKFENNTKKDFAYLIPILDYYGEVAKKWGGDNSEQALDSLQSWVKELYGEVSNLLK